MNGVSKDGRGPLRKITWRFAAICFLVTGALASGIDAQDQTRQGAAQDGPLVIRVEIEGVIGPAVAKHLADALDEAEARGAALLLLRMDTPGGLSTSMREMISDILASPVPVASYVAPSGARAASAGVYLLYASHVAAMAPGTNTGAATPVSIGGGGLPGGDGPAEGEGGAEKKDGEGDAAAESPAAPADPKTAKAVNDAVAYIRSLAELRGRNAEWAERAVREAASLSADAALDENVIDLIARDQEALLDALDGRTVSVGDEARVLEVAGARVETVEPSVVTNILRILSNPNIALMMMALGFYGLVFELATPGLGPGIPGVILLVLGLYSLNQLPLDYAGLALVGLGLAAMAAEAVTPTFGVLGVGGAVAFALGAALLVDTDVAEFQVAWSVIGAISLVSLALMTLVLGYVIRTQRRGAAHQSAMLGATAHVVDWADGSGHVQSRGERWNAVGADDLSPGDEAEVAEVDGLTLTVRRARTPEKKELS